MTRDHAEVNIPHKAGLSQGPAYHGRVLTGVAPSGDYNKYPHTGTGILTLVFIQI